MNVRVHLVVSVAGAVIAAGIAVQSASADPAKASGPVRSIKTADRAEGTPRWHAAQVSFSTIAAKNPQPRVSSETRRLDLSKLTMADFGDAE